MDQLIHGHHLQTFTYRPVVVEMTQLVGESLHVIWLEARRITDDIEVGGRDSALTDTLTHKEKVIPVQTHGVM